LQRGAASHFSQSERAESHFEKMRRPVKMDISILESFHARRGGASGWGLEIPYSGCTYGLPLAPTTLHRFGRGNRRSRMGSTGRSWHRLRGNWRRRSWVGGRWPPLNRSLRLCLLHLCDSSRCGGSIYSSWPCAGIQAGGEVGRRCLASAGDGSGESVESFGSCLAARLKL
jgi:hypothetical protein